MSPYHPDFSDVFEREHVRFRAYARRQIGHLLRLDVDTGDLVLTAMRRVLLAVDQGNVKVANEEHLIALCLLAMKRAAAQKGRTASKRNRGRISTDTENDFLAEPDRTHEVPDVEGWTEMKWKDVDRVIFRFVGEGRTFGWIAQSLTDQGSPISAGGVAQRVKRARTRIHQHLSEKSDA